MNRFTHTGIYKFTNENVVSIYTHFVNTNDNHYALQIIRCGHFGWKVIIHIYHHSTRTISSLTHKTIPSNFVALAPHVTRLFRLQYWNRIRLEWKNYRILRRSAKNFSKITNFGH